MRGKTSETAAGLLAGPDGKAFEVPMASVLRVPLI